MARQKMALFREPLLGFSVEIPEGWQFLPAAWSPSERMKRDMGEQEMLQLASKPFCCAMAFHDSPDVGYPTLQVTVRPSAVPDNDQARQVLEASVRGLGMLYEDVVIEEATHEAILSGWRANRIRAVFTLNIEKDGVLRKVRGIGRSWTVFTPGNGFTISMSSSADPAWYREDDFSEIIHSVRIGG